MVSVGVYAILFTQTLDALATMVVLPTIPFYAISLGATAFTISLLGSAYNLAQMFCSPALGALSDRVGRKTVMVIGLTAQAVCNGMMSGAETVPMLLLARVAVGVALSTGPVEMAYIMDDVTSEKDLSHVLVLQRVMTSAGALSGPLVARMFNEYPFPVLCRGLVCVNIFNLLIGMCLWKDAPQKDDFAVQATLSLPPSTTLGKEPAGFFGTLGSMFTNSATASLLLVAWVYTLGYGIGDGPEVVFFKEHFGFGRDEVCYFFVVTNLSSLVFSTVVPFVVEWLGAQQACIIGCMGASMSVLTLVVFGDLEWIPYVYGALMVGLFGSMIGLGYMHLVRRKCPKAMMGTMLGLQNSVNGFAGTIGPPIGGAIYGWNNFVPYVLTALIAVVTAGLYAAVPRDTTEREPLLPPWQRPKLRRVSTFGVPIYPDKSFTTQVHLNVFRIDFDPELRSLYEAYRVTLHVHTARGAVGNLKHIATVPGDMVAAQADFVLEHQSTLGESSMRHGESTPSLSPGTS